MTEKTGLPTEAKILQFKPRGGPVLTTWSDLEGTPKHTTTARVVPPDLSVHASNRWITDVFRELVAKAVEVSKFSAVPVHVLVENAIRQHGELNIHVAMMLADAVKQLRNADYDQRGRLGATAPGDHGTRRGCQAALSGPPLDLEGEDSGASSGSLGAPTVDL